MSGPAFDSGRLDAAFANVARQVDAGEVPAAVLGVARREGTPRIEAFQRSGGDPARADSIFLLASITKPIVATAVLQLVEAGSLSLRTPIRAYIPEFRAVPPGPGLPGPDLVTAQHLLSHTSGIVDPPEPPATEVVTRAQALEYALTAPLRFLPGTRYEYASVTFSLLGELIRRLSGLDYPEYLAERIFRPLGMVDTAFTPRDLGRVTWPRFGDPVLSDRQVLVRRFDSAAQPGGGLWSTAADVLAFGRAMLGGGALDGVRILGARWVELMTREQTAGVREGGAVPRDPTYGLGWSLPGLDNALPVSRRAFGHGGATGTRLLVEPAADLVLVYLTNVWGADERHALEAFGGLLGALDA